MGNFVKEIRAGSHAHQGIVSRKRFETIKYADQNRPQSAEHAFNEVLRLGEPDFPFCLGWANHSWMGTWQGGKNRMLIEQTYPGRADYERHFHSLLEAFHDPRYIRVRGKPLFVVFNPKELP